MPRLPKTTPKPVALPPAPPPAVLVPLTQWADYKRHHALRVVQVTWTQGGVLTAHVEPDLPPATFNLPTPNSLT